jgi:hypothetical protein
MQSQNIIKGTLAYFGASFLVQFISHFVVNTDHYHSIPFMRPEPLMFLGLITMILQGIILSTIYLKWASGDYNIMQGLKFSWLMGAFFVSYLALVEADKYAVPNVTKWIIIEGTAGTLQFTLFGLLLGKFVYNK